MQFFVVVAVSLTILVGTSSAAAQSSELDETRLQEAKEAFAAGTRAYEGGDFETALTSFQRAYELTRSPDLLYNIATVSDRMRRDEDALRAYQGYLEARPRSADREHVESRIEVLRESIEAQERAEQEAELEAQRAAMEAAARIKAERPLTRYVGPGPGPWITMGAGGATLVTGAVFIGLGQRDKNKVQSALPGSSFSSVASFADRSPRRTATGIALMSVGGAAVLGGLIWQLTGGHEETMPEVSIGPGGISVRGKF